MKDSFDMITDVRSLINVPTIADAITGKVYPFVRPNNSDKVDIVIGRLYLQNQQIQNGAVNIRIHAPSIQGALDGKVQSMPDMVAFSQVTNLLLPLLDNQFRDTFSTEVIIPGDVIKDSDGTYFCLIRISYQSYNSNYKNI